MTIELGRQSNFVNYFVWSPKTMSRICATALEEEIAVDYVRKLIAVRAIPAPSYLSKKWPWPIEVYTLGRFEVVVDGTSMSFARKAPKQLLRLLKAIIAFGSVGVPEENLMDALWPDQEADAAHGALQVSVRRLRTLLGSHEVLQYQKGILSLNLQVCWIDAIAFDRQLKSATGSTHEQEQALALYRGNFLPEERGTVWTFELRDKLHRAFLHHLSLVAEQYGNLGRWSDTLRLYLDGLEGAPLAESFYQGAIRAYLKLGRRAEAAATGARMREIFVTTLRVTPLPAGVDVFEYPSQD
jgi:DNA-binding SARP family transcriptional activator